MNELNTKITQLTDKIYKEGLEKAESESERILASAQQSKETKLAHAQHEAEAIISKARREAEEIKRATENEIKIKGNQLISDLKNEIRHALQYKLVDQSIEKAFSDQDFLKSLIMEVASHWSKGDNLELILPEKLEKKISKAFEKDIQAHAVNLNVTFNHKIKDGFRIAREGDAYQLTFSEDDFKEFFGSYLKETTHQFLF